MDIFCVWNLFSKPSNNQKPVKYVPDPPKRVYKKGDKAAKKVSPIPEPKIKNKKKPTTIKVTNEDSKENELKTILNKFKISEFDNKNKQIRNIRTKYKQLTGKLFATKNQHQKNKLQKEIDLLAKARMLLNKKWI